MPLIIYQLGCGGAGGRGGGSAIFGKSVISSATLTSAQCLFRSGPQTTAYPIPMHSQQIQLWHFRNIHQALKCMLLFCSYEYRFTGLWLPMPVPGEEARFEACPLGMQAAPSSIPTSGTFFRGDLVMKTFLRPFSLFL